MGATIKASHLLRFPNEPLYPLTKHPLKILVVLPRQVHVRSSLVQLIKSPRYPVQVPLTFHADDG